MFASQTHYFKDGLNQTYAFTTSPMFAAGDHQVMLACKAYARQTLVGIAENNLGVDPFQYKLIDLWLDVFQKPWAVPRTLDKIIGDLATQIANQQLFVYLADSPLWHANFGAGSGGAAPSGGLGSPDSNAHDQPRTQVAAEDGALRESPAPESQLSQHHVHETVGLDTVVVGPNGHGETIGAMYDKVYDPQGNQLPNVDSQTAESFNDAYLQAQRTSEYRAEGYKMAVQDAALGLAAGPVIGVAAGAAGKLVVPLAARGKSVLGAMGKTDAPNGASLKQTGGGSGTESADELYDAIRASQTDVSTIAQNTGIKSANIQKVKDHVFYKEHLLDKYVDYGVPAEKARFDSDLSQAQAWQRLETGTHTDADITWLKHETAEQWYETRHKSGYTEAHNTAESKWPGNPWGGM